MFDDTAAHGSADVMRYFFRTTPVPGCRYAEFYTLWINLECDPEYLFEKMSRTTRSQIRRAQIEGLRYEFASTPPRIWLDQFFDFFDSFAKSRNIKRVNRARILALLDQNALDLSRISSPDGRVLVWHANIRSGRYAFCLYSASLFRQEEKSVATYIGRANRLLHWSDMLRFREEGVTTYDFGGWYAGKQNVALLQVNDFKERFGGELVVRYNSDRGLTWKGILALRLRAAAQWVQRPFLQTGLGVASQPH